MTQQDDITQRVLTDDEINTAIDWPAANTTMRAENDRAMAREVEAAVLRKLRAPVSSIREGFELTYAADADDPACAADLSHFTNGWRACVMSQVRAPVADEHCSACNPQVFSVEQLEKDPLLVARLWRKPADTDGSLVERILEHVSEYGESIASSSLLSVRTIARRNLEARIEAELADAMRSQDESPLREALSEIASAWSARTRLPEEDGIQALKDIARAALASAPVTEDDEMQRIKDRGPAYPHTPNTAPPTPLASAPVAGEAKPANIKSRRPTGVLSMHGASLHMKPDGSGEIIVAEEDFTLEDDRDEGPDGPKGSVHWVARLPASEIAALRNFLTGHARPSDDALWDQTLAERDEYHDVADKLANAIADHLLIEIGEHSSSNCPWMRALEAIENAAPQVSEAVSQPLIARALNEWHEDDGPVTWWAWCGHEWAGEAPWCGTPLDQGWPGYHTHWTPIPGVPAALSAPQASAENARNAALEEAAQALDRLHAENRRWHNEFREGAAVVRALKQPQADKDGGQQRAAFDHPVFAFLLGEGQLHGVDFGDRHPSERGAYWWRKDLRAALSAAQAEQGERDAG